MEEDRKKELEICDKLCIVGESILVPEVVESKGYRKMNYTDIKFVKDKKGIFVWSQNYANLD